MWYMTEYGWPKQNAADNLGDDPWLADLGQWPVQKTAQGDNDTGLFIKSICIHSKYVYQVKRDFARTEEQT